MNLPDLTGRDKRLPLLTCHTSIKAVNAQTDWMNKKSKHYSDEHFLRLIGILGFYTAGHLTKPSR